MNEYDKQDKRLKQIIAVSWITIILILVLGTAFLSYSFDKMDKRIVDVVQHEIKSSLPQVKDGERGPQGLQGLQGERGDMGTRGPQGSNSTSTLTIVQQPVYTNVPVAGPQGEPGVEGAEGPQGPAGRTVFIRQNPETAAIECRYSGDTNWYPAENCE